MTTYFAIKQWGVCEKCIPNTYESFENVLQHIVSLFLFFNRVFIFVIIRHEHSLEFIALVL